MPVKPKRLTLPYEPNGPGQQAFADAIASGAKVILALGGIRSGKTFWACVEALKQIYIDGKRPTLGWLVARTYPMSVILERMWKQLCLLPDGTNLIAKERVAERAYLMRPSKKNPDNYYRVEVKSADDPERLRGASIAWAVVDEAAMMDRNVYHILLGRVLDSSGILILATTPLGRNWLETDIIQKSYTDPRYAVIRMPTDQNKYLKGEEIETLRKQYESVSSNKARQELGGEIVDFEGKVFDQFNPGTHIVKYPEMIDSRNVFLGIDWGYNDPFVCTFSTCIDGVWYVLDEYYRTRGLLSEHAAWIKNHPLWPQVKRIWADPSGAQQRREFLNFGIQCLPARRPKDMNRIGWPEARARLMNKLFASRLQDPMAGSTPKTIPGLVYTDNIRFGVKETIGLCFDKYTSVVEDPVSGDANVAVVDKEGSIYDKNAREKITDKDNHFVDALGYCLFSEVRTFGGLNPHYEADSGDVVEQNEPQTPEEKLKIELEARYRQADKDRKAEKLDKKDSYSKQFDLDTPYSA